MHVSHMLPLPLLLLCASVHDSHGHRHYDYDIVEGDIQVPREGRSGKALSASPLTSQWQLFPLGQVRYYIETEAVNAEGATPMAADDVRVLGAVADWEAKTCIRFTKCASAGSCARPYIKFIAGSGCNSPVGTYGSNVNTINLEPACSTGSTIHEIGHSLGLLHEQMRKDRDEYVVVDSTAVQDGYVYAFDSMGSSGRDLGAYDYSSIMHYHSTAFSNGNGPTIIAPEPIGQRSSLSSGDVAAIQFMYNECSANYARPTCMPSIDVTETHLIPHSKAWNLDFNVMYKSSKSVRVSYAGTTAPAGQMAYSRASGSSLGNMGFTELTFTPSAAVAGQTFTLSATFTGTDGPSTTCEVRVRVADAHTLCFGISASDPNVCSGRGTCVEDLLTPCQCASGYAGPDCSGTVTCPADVLHPFDGELTWTAYGAATEDSSVFVAGGASMRVGEVGSSSRSLASTFFAASEAKTVSFHMSAMGGSTQQWPAVYLRSGSTTCAIVQRYSNGQWLVGNSLVANTAPEADRFYAVKVEMDWSAMTYKVLVDGDYMGSTASMPSSCAGGLTRAIFFGNGWLDEFKVQCTAGSAPPVSVPPTPPVPRTAVPTPVPTPVPVPRTATPTRAPATTAPRTRAPATDAPAPVPLPPTPATRGGLAMSIYKPGGDMLDFPDFDALMPDFAVVAERVEFVDSVWTDIDGSLVEDFAAELEGALEVTVAGEYTLHLTSDDGSRLWLDGEKEIENGGTHGARTKTTKLWLSAGSHPMKIHFFERRGSALLDLKWTLPSGAKEVIPTENLSPRTGVQTPVPTPVPVPRTATPSRPTRAPATQAPRTRAPATDAPRTRAPATSVPLPPTPATRGGLAMSIYKPGGDMLDFPDFDALMPDFAVVAERVEFADSMWTDIDGSLVENFAAELEGALEVAVAGEYKLHLTSDDGSRLWLDGEKEIENGGTHGARTKTTKLWLSAGSHPMKIHFFERRGSALLDLKWTLPSGAKEVIPLENLSH